MNQDARGEVSIRGVSKRFGEVVALHALDLDIAAGSFFSLLGPSGCGKTTLLRIIAGFELPDDGVVMSDGDDITRGLPNGGRSTWSSSTTHCSRT